MICPNCGRAYRDGVDYCNNCDIELIPDDEEEKSSDYEEYVEILSAYSIAEIEYITSVLDTEEIRYHFETDIYTSQTEELIKPAVLLVHEEDYDKTEALLRANDLMEE